MSRVGKSVGSTEIATWYISLSKDIGGTGGDGADDRPPWKAVGK